MAKKEDVIKMIKIKKFLMKGKTRYKLLFNNKPIFGWDFKFHKLWRNGESNGKRKKRFKKRNS